MSDNTQAMHERRLQLAANGMFEMKRGAVWVPITKDEAKLELAAGRKVYHYNPSGPAEVVEIV